MGRNFTALHGILYVLVWLDCIHDTDYYDIKGRYELLIRHSQGQVTEGVFDAL